MGLPGNVVCIPCSKRPNHRYDALAARRTQMMGYRERSVLACGQRKASSLPCGNP